MYLTSLTYVHNEHMTFVCGVEEIRKGRKIFLWNFDIGNQNDDHAGTSKKETINLVMLHGTAASHYQYLKVCEYLKSHFVDGLKVSISIWLFDHVGCGESPLVEDPNAYSDEEQLEDLNHIMSRVDASRPTFLCGHSYGPMGFLKYMRSHPVPSLKGTILISTGFQDGPGPTFDGGPSIFRLPVFILKCLQSSMTNSFLKLALAKGADPELISLVRTECNENDMFVVKQYYSAHLWLSSEASRKILGDTPSLVVHGIEDGILPISSGQFVANQLRAEFVAIEEASHLVLIEKPREVAEAISNFIGSILKKKQ